MHKQVAHYKDRRKSDESGADLSLPVHKWDPASPSKELDCIVNYHQLKSPLSNWVTMSYSEPEAKVMTLGVMLRISARGAALLLFLPYLVVATDGHAPFLHQRVLL